MDTKPFYFGSSINFTYELFMTILYNFLSKLTIKNSCIKFNAFQDELVHLFFFLKEVFRMKKCQLHIYIATILMRNMCFRCSACDTALSNWYFEKDGLLFCKTDYWSKFGEACQQCDQVNKIIELHDFLLNLIFF